MNINITLRGVELNSNEINGLRVQAHSALAGLNGSIESLDIVLEDFHGPREGDDQVCRLILRRANEPAMILQQRGEHALTVGLAALERAGLLLRRRQEKTVVRRKSTAAFN
jgi:hypothetical protein